jgi:cell division protein FtsQ
MVVVNLPYFALQQVDVTGTKRLSKQEVIESAEIDSGANLLTVNIAAVARRVETHPWIRCASVYRRFPGVLQIEVVERQPRAMLTAGKLYYVDDRGEFFSKRLPGDGVNLPLLTGLTREDLETRRNEVEDVVRASLSLLELMEKTESDLKPGVISEIRIDLGEGLTAITQAGRSVVFGRGGFEGKLQRYGKLKEHLVRSRRWNGARVIDLDFEDRALVRWGKPRLQG